jgi:glutamine amidotransferase|tara:strand:+ start:170 stop:784 length:615 start_codon:yes stop_codon:yes gene_type:complete
MIISIVSYGTGNINSVLKAVSDLNYTAKVVKNPRELSRSDKIILPGVGSFFSCMSLLNLGNWTEELTYLVKEKKVDILGICLGMQLLAKSSEEDIFSSGLGFLECEVKSLKNEGCTNVLPHMGWNSVEIHGSSKLLKDIPNKTDFYFANSYFCKNIKDEYITGFANYDIKFPATVEFENIYGSQFHPEKSSKMGKKLLENFLKV